MVGSNEYQNWYKGKSTVLPWEGEGLNWINKLIWLIPSHTGTPVLVQWSARVELPFGDEQSVFISSPVLNPLEPSWNHTLRLCSSWATFAAPAVCWVPTSEAGLFQVMMPLPCRCVCPPVPFRNSSCRQVPEVPSGLEMSCRFAYAEALSGSSSGGRSGSALLALAICQCCIPRAEQGEAFKEP